MKNVKFIKEPGYIYDLFFLFILYFNKESYLRNSTNGSKSHENNKYFDRLISDFSPVSDELLPFFYLKDNKMSFITQYYYISFKREFIADYNLSFIQRALSNYNQVVYNLINYYFPEATEEDFEEYKKSVLHIKNLIKNSKYDRSLKSSLYELFLDPIPSIRKLSAEIMIKYNFLSKYNNFEKVLNYVNDFDYENFVSKTEQYFNCKIDLDQYNDCYISVSLLAKDFACLCYYDKVMIEIVGFDCNDYMNFMLNKNFTPDLDVFGNCLSEKNRVEILRLIRRKGEITIRDIEQELGFTGTNAYYHINMMIRNRMVEARYQGRVVFYTINKNYFDSVCNILSDFSNNVKLESSFNR